MRKIDIEKVKSELTDDWLDQARQHIENLKALDLAERREYIKDHSDFWGKDVRRSFWRIGGKKCWYSEEQLSFKECELEHYRPKGRVAKDSHPGYWWLAFNWRNYRIASKIVNQRAEDDRNRDVQGKGTYFPLIGGERSSEYNPSREDKLSLGNEEPLLLDPINAEDVAMLSYDFLEGMYEGRIIPDKEICLSSDEKKRVKDSIAYYSLNDGHLIDKRFKKYTELEASCEVLESITQSRMQRELTREESRDWNKHYNILSTLISPDSEFSSMCKAALDDLGPRGWNKKLLKTV